MGVYVTEGDMHLSDANEADGNPVTRPAIENGLRKKGARFDYRVLFYVIVAAAVGGGLITSSSNIMDAIWLLRTENPETITLPHLPVTLRNSGPQSILLPVKGHCLLWPPKPHSWDYEGSYDFKHTDRTVIDSDRISVPARGARDVLIQLTRANLIHQTETSLKRFLTAGDWHIQFIMETNQYGRTIITSGHIPFTREAMAAGYLMEVYRKPSPRCAMN